jgi:hypothetical protein
LREYISIPSNTGERPNHQIFIPNPLRTSEQHFTAHHFFNAHKSRIWFPILTFSAASASMTRCLSNRNLSVPNQVVHCLIITCTHTHQIFNYSKSTKMRCDRTEQCPNKTLDTVQTNLLSSFWASNQGRSVTSGKIEWANLPVSAESHFVCHALTALTMSHQRWYSGSLLTDSLSLIKAMLSRKIQTLDNFPRQHSLDRTQAISENKTSFRRLYTPSNLS